MGKMSCNPKLSMSMVLALLIIGLLFHARPAYAECNVCQENQAACINSTSFYLCFAGNTPNTEALYHCKEGFDCTNLNAICIQKNNAITPSCGDTSLCGMCSAQRNYLFACLSRTTFQMCYGALRPTGKIGYCPQGSVCDATSDSICVKTTEPYTLTCDILDESTSTVRPTSSTPTTITTSSSTTSSSVTPTTPIYPLTPTQVCEQMRQVGLFPTMPHDPFCRRYIYCSYNNGIIRGVENACSAGTYYNIEYEMCSFVKPAYCI